MRELAASGRNVFDQRFRLINSMSQPSVLRFETNLSTIEAFAPGLAHSACHCTASKLIPGCFCLPERNRPCSLLRLENARMTNGTQTLGLIAGNRTLPLVFAELARKQGVATPGGRWL
jgi:hypothetical protein